MMTNIKNGGNAAHRRKRLRMLNRLGKLPVLASAPILFAEGQEVRITSDEYGKSYNGTKGVVLSIAGTTVVVQSKKRKTPLEVQASHLS